MLKYDNVILRSAKMFINMLSTGENDGRIRLVSSKSSFPKVLVLPSGGN